VKSLRSEIDNVSDHNRTVKVVIVQLDTDARDVTFPVRK
jgi:hypothetical protein